ncbi:hypothetical protein GGS21DRAFT_404877 [Xylaria nigripes]|nr:hypothetical protein GGS21DRAFT_404877 [Xylaria nigripes]
MEKPMDRPRHSGVRLRKSRHGCLVCKRRKVKCDEVKPVCGNCTKRYYDVEPCEYPPVSARRCRQDRQPTEQIANTSVVLHSLQPPDVLSRPIMGVSSSGAQRLLEMRLMHHYTQSVALELPASYGFSSRELWLDKVPQMAFESDLLLDSLLALSAIHMQDLIPQDHKLAMAVTHYLDRTLVKHRSLLGHINTSPAEPLFITAFMLCITSWQYAHRRSTTSEPYRVPLNVFALVRGCCILHRQYSGWLSQAGFDARDLWSLVPSDGVIQTHHPFLSEVDQDIKKLLEAFHVTDMPIDEAGAYQHTANCVLNLHMALVQKIENSTLQRLVFTMAVQMQPRYLKMLEASQPLALALYARILAVLGFIDRLWWSRGPNHRDVLQYSILGIRDMIPVKYAWIMEWPQKVLTGEITLTS